MTLLSDLSDFIEACKTLDNYDIFDLFEDGCTEELRELIYSFGDPDCYEPFRDAMYNLGFVDF